MNVNNRILKPLALVASLAIAGPVHAGKEGVSFFYGAGIGAMNIDEDAASDYKPDVAPTGALFLGIEEDGWAFEYLGLQTTETGTNDNETDYKVSGSVVSLSYRTVEKNGSYYKIGFGKADTDVDLIENNVTTTGNTDGNVYILGWGMRMKQGDRIELDYSYYDPGPIKVTDAIELTLASKVHMLSLRYMFGGSAPSER
jgi:hypothetical protein